MPSASLPGGGACVLPCSQVIAEVPTPSSQLLEEPCPNWNKRGRAPQAGTGKRAGTQSVSSYLKLSPMLLTQAECWMIPAGMDDLSGGLLLHILCIKAVLAF